MKRNVLLSFGLFDIVHVGMAARGNDEDWASPGRLFSGIV